MGRQWTVAVIAAVALLCSAGRASADFVATIQGTDCEGLFGTNFESCAIPDLFDPNTSPVIAKFSGAGTVRWDINSALFPTIAGDEFSFTFGPNGSGSWTYMPGADDPATLVSFYVAKGGDYFNLFSNAGNTNSWFAPTNPENGQPVGLAHLTFYQGGISAVPTAATPEPGSLLLLAGGVAAAMARFRRKAPGSDLVD